MLWVALTVIFYTASSLGDKYISSVMKCCPAEFSFLVSVGTAVWLALLLPFTGWSMALTTANIAGLALNVIFSWVCNIWQSHTGSTSSFAAITALSVCMAAGLYLIVRGQEHMVRLGLISVAFILSKFFYGLQMGRMKDDCSAVSVLLVVMLIIALLQLPKVSARELAKKEHIGTAIFSRAPNALGLLTESAAAMQNIFLYAMVQPVQFLLLFIFSLLKKENMDRKKMLGSILCLVTITIIAICRNGGLD